MKNIINWIIKVAIGITLLIILLLALSRLMKYSFSLIGGGDSAAFGYMTLFIGLFFFVFLTMVIVGIFFKSN